MSRRRTETETVAFLRTVTADQYGTPDKKLPDCPRCEEDELWAHSDRSGFSCYRCGWTVEIAVNGIADWLTLPLTVDEAEAVTSADSEDGEEW